MIRWITKKLTGRKDGNTHVENFVIEIVRSSGIQKGVAGIGGFRDTYKPELGFYATVFALADYANSFIGEGRDQAELFASIIPKLFPKDGLGREALSRSTEYVGTSKFMDLVIEIEERIEQAHNKYADGPGGVENLVDEMSFVKEYL